MKEKCFQLLIIISPKRTWGIKMKKEYGRKRKELAFLLAVILLFGSFCYNTGDNYTYAAENKKEKDNDTKETLYIPDSSVSEGDSVSGGDIDDRRAPVIGNITVKEKKNTGRGVHYEEFDKLCHVDGKSFCFSAAEEENNALELSFTIKDEGGMIPDNLEVKYSTDAGNDWDRVESSRIIVKGEDIRVYFDGKNNTETEYLFSIFYKGKNGIPMTLGTNYVPGDVSDGIMKEGCYTLKSFFVVDMCAPELMDFDVVSTEDKKSLDYIFKEKYYLYFENNPNAGIKVSFVIKDKYFCRDGIALEIKDILNEGGKVTYKNLNFESRGEDRRVSFELVPEDGTAAEYVISAAYTDLAGQKIRLAEGESFSQADGVSKGSVEDGYYTLSRIVKVEKRKLTIDDFSSEVAGWSQTGRVNLFSIYKKAEEYPLTMLEYEMYCESAKEQGVDKKKGSIDLGKGKRPESIDIPEDGRWRLRIILKNDNNVYVNKLIEVKKDSAAPYRKGADSTSNNVDVDSPEEDNRDKIFAVYKGDFTETVDGKITGIAARKNIEVTLYVQDDSSAGAVENTTDYSDISLVAVLYNGKEIEGTVDREHIAIKNEEGRYKMSEVSDGCAISDIYRIVKVTVPDSSEDEQASGVDISSKLQIVRIADNAGNVTRWENPVVPILLDGEAAEEMFLVIDGIAPVLNTVVYPESISVINDVYFYPMETTFSLSVEEHYFSRIQEPVVRKNRNNQEITMDLTWDSDNLSDRHTVNFPLEGEPDKETEYVLKMKYKDWVGNPLCAENPLADKVDDKGEFTSHKMVIDRKAPRLQNFRIEAVETGAGEYQEVGIVRKDSVWYTYHTTMVRADFSIEDKYFNKDNLEARIYYYNTNNLNNAPVEISVSIDEENIKKSETDADIYEISFQFDGEEYKNGYYLFEVSYKDNVGNRMIPGDGLSGDRGAANGHINTEGVYTTTEMLSINALAPCITEINIRGGNPKDGFSSELNGGPHKMEGTDKEKGYYYVPSINGEDLTVSFSISEANMDTNEVKLFYCNEGENWKTIESSKISWQENKAEGQGDFSVWTATVALDGEKNTEVAYKFRMEYINFNGKALELSRQYTPEGANSVENTGKGIFETVYRFVIDNKAPELVDFIVTGYDRTDSEIQLVKDGEGVYYLLTNGKDGNRVEVQYIIADNPKYFDESRITITDVHGGNNKIPAASGCIEQGGLYTGTVSLHKEERTVSIYRLSIHYRDQSGREMILGENFPSAGLGAGRIGSGIFTMDNSVVIDEESPVLSDMSFNKPYQCADENRETCPGIQDKNTKLYYSSDIKITFTVREAAAQNTVPGRTGFDEECMKLVLYKKGAHEGPEDAWEVKVNYKIKEAAKDTYKINFDIKADKNHITDGEYYFTFSYTDRNGNPMRSGGKAEKGIQGLYDDCLYGESTYVSPVFVLDTTPPEITYIYHNGNKELEKHSEEHNFYKNVSDIQIRIKETNFRAGELVEWARNASDESIGEGIVFRQWKFDEKGKKQYKAKEDVVGCIKDYNPKVNDKDIYRLTIPVREEANYELAIVYTDMAGNRADIPLTQMTYDNTKPRIELFYRLKDQDKFLKMNYGRDKYLFTQKGIVVQARITDEVSGVKSLYHTVSAYDGNGGAQVEKEGTHSNREQKFEYVFTGMLPLNTDTDDFDGFIGFNAADWTGNEKSINSKHLIESSGRFKASATAGFTIDTAASRVVDGIKYYNASAGAVSFTINAGESFSGLKKVSVNAPKGQLSMNTAAGMQENQGKYVWEAPRKRNGLVKTYSNTGSFAANAQNDSNQLYASMTMESNTGYMKTVTSEPFIIDVVPPTIEVSYNDIPAYNGSYYKDIRVATVTITERNFSSADVVWNITNTEGAMPVISAFTNDNSEENSTNDTKHVCTVTFAEDGDYTFGIDFMDKAGNTIKYQGEPFTVDRTVPTVSLTYDNNEDAVEGYFNAGRVATLRIEEHNFRAEDVIVRITAGKNGQAVRIPAIGPFQNNGDVHSASIRFDYDGDFSVDVSYVDMAGNEAADMEQQNFTIDLTDPEIIFEGIEEFSANKGTVAPAVLLTDDNFDLNQIKVELKGYKNGLVNYENTVSGMADGQKITFTDFTRNKDVDDMYTLTASITDKSGRRAEREIVFSVNRFGSVYQLADDTRAMIQKYYTNEEQDVIIEETNVDTLTKKELYLLRDGEKIDLREDTDYRIEQSGDDVSWKKYTYTLFRENFIKEGVYNVVLYSQDKASNETENRIKGNDIEFVVDKTAPVVAVSGVENRRQYMVDERLVSVDAKDNSGLSGITVFINNKQTPYRTYTAEEIQEAGGVISINLGSSHERRNLIVMAEDLAGNINEVSVEGFLITSDVLVQFVSNAPLVTGTVVSIGFMVVLAVYLILRTKKKNRKSI